VSSREESRAGKFAGECFGGMVNREFEPVPVGAGRVAFRMQTKGRDKRERARQMGFPRRRGGMCDYGEVVAARRGGEGSAVIDRRYRRGWWRRP